MEFKFQFAEPLPFIRKTLTSGYVEVVNGCHCIVAGDFKQFIKASELKAIIEKNIFKGEAAQQRPTAIPVLEPEPAKADTVETDAPAKGRGIRRK